MYYYPNNNMAGMYGYGIPANNMATNVVPIGYGGYNNAPVDPYMAYQQSLYNDMAKLNQYDQSMSLRDTCRQYMGNATTDQLQQHYGFSDLTKMVIDANQAQQQQQQPMANYNAYNQAMTNPYNFNYMNPPQQINNLVGGYYGGNYNTYNPYFSNMQAQYLEAQRREECKQQSAIMQKLLNISCKYNGIEVPQEALDYIDESCGVQPQSEMIDYNNYDPKLAKKAQIRANQAQLYSMNLVETSISPICAPYIAMAIKTEEEYRKRAPHSMGLVEYMNTCGQQDYIAALESEQKRMQDDVIKLYDHDAYQSRIQKDRYKLFGKALDPNSSTIDDQEIHLPFEISDKTRQERRARFMQSLFKEGEIL